MNGEDAKPILIVEDEVLVALDLEDMLVELGYDVIGCVSDAEALESVRSGPILAFVDINLRDGPTGPIIARQLATKFGTKIVYVTANPSQIGEPAATAVGLIQKPFSRSCVQAIARMVFEGLKAIDMPKGLQLFPDPIRVGG